MKNGVSIIIITYNRKDDLIYTLNSIKNMNIKTDHEVIIIDQNSDDGTENIVSLFIKESNTDINYTLLESNYGVAKGRNIGVEKSKYENLLFIDDDAHFIEDDAIDKVAAFMNKYKDYNVFAFQIRDNNGGYYQWPYPKRMLKVSNTIFETNKYIGCGHAIKKDFFNEVGGYSTNLFFWGEETELVLKSFNHDEKSVLYIGEIEVVHRVSAKGRYKDGSRFYYQVRNRLYLIRNMYPIGKSLFYNYYKYGYKLKASVNKWNKEYNQAIIDLEKMKITRKNEMTLKSLMKYYTVHYL